MVKLAELVSAIEKIETAIDAAEKQNYDEIRDRLWEQRRALNMVASFMIPNSQEDAQFQHSLIAEYTEFVDDVPTRDSDRDDAIEAILRLNKTLSEYRLGT